MIYGLTTCVGDTYAYYLKNSLVTWLSTLDLLLIVTDEKTWKKHFENMAVERPSMFPLFCVTDIFTRYGASFNKGAALSEGFAVLKPTDWVCNFDADIYPPKNWREIVESRFLSPGKLFGSSHRYREDGTLIPDADYPNIWGFFHLWHVCDRHSWRRPVFDSTCGHAGNYDHTFMMQWEPAARVDLWPELKLVHQGEPRQKWFGNDQKNDRKMANLFTLGLWDAWQTRAGHITAPAPEEIVIGGNDSAAVMRALSLYTTPDPFKYKVTVKDS